MRPLIIACLVAAAAVFSVSSGEAKNREPAVAIAAKGECRLVIAVRGAPRGSRAVIQVRRGRRWHTAWVRRSVPARDRLTSVHGSPAAAFNPQNVPLRSRQAVDSFRRVPARTL